MTIAWRLVKKKYVSEAFTGEGAKLSGERWNHKGIPVVYAADSLSLAVLESFVNQGPEGEHFSFVYFRIEIPNNIIEKVKPSDLPPNWRDLPSPTSTKDFGTRWAISNRSCVLRVPSVITLIEYNYILNPLHPDFNKINIGVAEPFSFDQRMSTTRD